MSVVDEYFGETAAVPIYPLTLPFVLIEEKVEATKV
jgi:hypothetical protein